MDPVYQRINAVAKRYGAERALEEAVERGMMVLRGGVPTKAIKRLMWSYEGFERERLLFQWHTGGFRPDFLSGVAV